MEPDAMNLADHERASRVRYEGVMDKIDEIKQWNTDKESKMSEGIMDKVNINVGEGRGGDGGNMAAVIAALGNRNQGNDNAALIAALGNRNDSAANLGPLMAMLANGRDNHNGMDNMWPLLLLLLGRRGFGEGDCDGRRDGGVSPAQAALLQTLLEGQSDLRAAVPTAALETQGVVQSSAANTKDAIQNSLIAELTAISNVKDAVQNGFTLTGRDLAAVNQNVSAQGCQTRETVEAAKTEILSALSQNEIDRLRHERDGFQRQVEIQSLRSQVEVNQTVNTTQAQAQGQFQLQANFNDVLNRINRLNDRIDIVHQEARATNSNVIAGNTAAVTTGVQTASPTNVNTRG